MAPQLSNTHASDRSRDEMVTAAKKKVFFTLFLFEATITK
jgi:hypothetical protein